MRRFARSLLEKFRPDGQPGGMPVDPLRELQVATCVLLLEAAHADAEFSPVEEQCLADRMQRHFGLSAADFADIREEAEAQRRGSVELWGFARRIREHAAPEERRQVVEMVWSVLYADGVLDGHEDYLVHVLARILGLDHRALIDAKVHVLQRLQTS